MEARLAAEGESTSPRHQMAGAKSLNLPHSMEALISLAVLLVAGAFALGVYHQLPNANE